MKISASIRVSAAAFLMAVLLSCSHNDLGGVLRQASPVLAPLSISKTTYTSITLDAPVLQKAWNPGGTISAYIGVSGTIVCTGTDVTGASAAPVDVTASGYTFTGLTISTTYTIIVVAENELGYWVRSITQSTADCSPKLNNLAVNIGSSSITLVKPSFSLTGNPIPAVTAWIGVKGTITQNGKDVTGSIAGPISAASGDYAFTGLSSAEQYTIFVVAENTSGYDVKTINAGISGSKPVLLPLTVSSVGLTSIALAQPEFSTAGSPPMTVKGWIGKSLAVSGTTVSGTIIEGAVDVSAGYTFSTGLTDDGIYDIVVIAENSAGYDVMTIGAGIAGVSPKLNALTVSAKSYHSISLDAPTFSVSGSPTVTVKGWIGTGLTVAGKTVSGTLIESGVDVSGGYVFNSGLSPFTDYDIVVIAENSVNYDVKTLTEKTNANKQILTFSIPAESAVCVVNNVTHTITGNVPFYRDVDSLIASFTLPAATTLSVASTPQTSGSTVNDFYSSVTTPVVYTATWADGTTQDYDVTISNFGSVTTPALSIGTDADLNAPKGMATDGTDLYIANSGNYDIVKVSTPGAASPSVQLYAGQKGVAGFLDGLLLNDCTFHGPRGICHYTGASFYIADWGVYHARLMDATNVTFVDFGAVYFHDIATDGTDQYATAGNGYVYKVGTPTALNDGNVLTGCVGITYTSLGLLYVAADWMLVHMNGVGYDHIAGGSNSGQRGLVDGAGTAARFNGISYITSDNSGKYLYLSDSTAVRKLNLASKRVTTIAGTSSAGASDGLGSTASFSTPQGIALIGTVLYVVDGNGIRKIE